MLSIKFPFEILIPTKFNSILVFCIWRMVNKVYVKMRLVIFGGDNGF